VPDPNGDWYNRGYNIADDVIDNGGPDFSVTILGFGKPEIQYSDIGPTYGVRIIGNWIPPIHVTTAKVAEIATDVADGFFARASQLPLSERPSIIIALGTTNYLSPGQPFSSEEFYQHGRAWGSMIIDLNRKHSAYSPTVTFQGALDVEYAWSDADHALKWAQGFEEVTRAPCPWCSDNYYFAYASCDDCYWPGHPDPTPGRTLLRNYHPEATRVPAPGVATSTPIPWTLDEAVGVTIANRAARSLPQIYYPVPGRNVDQAYQWAWLDSYAATHSLCLDEYGIARGIPNDVAFRGIMADGTGGDALPPDQAWQRLWMEASSRVCTLPPAGGMIYLTPIFYYPVYPPQ
jgi:hypothetical protein